MWNHASVCATSNPRMHSIKCWIKSQIHTHTRTHTLAVRLGASCRLRLHCKLNIKCPADCRSLCMRLPQQWQQQQQQQRCPSTLQPKVLHIFEMLFANECRLKLRSLMVVGIGRFAALQQYKTKGNFTASLNIYKSTHIHTHTNIQPERHVYGLVVPSTISSALLLLLVVCAWKSRTGDRSNRFA